MIADVSANGARILARSVPDGDLLAVLEIRRYGMFPGEIVWRDDRGAGIRFLDSPHRVADAMRPTLSPLRL